jgi:hypothetical protein
VMEISRSIRSRIRGGLPLAPTLGKPPRLAFVASQHFFIARLPLLAVMQGGASRAIPPVFQTTRLSFKFRSRPLLPVDTACACSAIWTAVPRQEGKYAYSKIV